MARPFLYNDYLMLILQSYKMTKKPTERFYVNKKSKNLVSCCGTRRHVLLARGPIL